MSDGIYELPGKEEVLEIRKENNNVLYNQVLQNNEDDSNIHINNSQARIPFNNYYQRNTFNKNQNKKNNDINNENSLSIIRSSFSAAPIDDKQSKISKSMNINYNYNQNEQLNLNENNNNIPGIKLQIMNDNIERNDKMGNINSSKTNPSVVIIKKVNEENEVKENKFKKIFYLILFYLSSVTNNVILHFIVSIVEKIRGLIK